MLPLDVEDEILVLLLGPHDADGLPGTDQHAVLHRPGVGVGVAFDPSGQVLAVEQVPRTRSSPACSPPAARNASAPATPIVRIFLMVFILLCAPLWCPRRAQRRVPLRRFPARGCHGATRRYHAPPPRREGGRVRFGRWSLLGVILLAAAAPGRGMALEITETRFEGRPRFQVRTERATWLYDQAGGGFSRLVDREGRDWVRAELPEPVPRVGGGRVPGPWRCRLRRPGQGAGHPGFDRVHERDRRSRHHPHGQPLRPLGLVLTFTETTATFTMEKADPVHPWWFLYEGPSCRNLRPERKLWARRTGGPYQRCRRSTPRRFDRWRWVYFGDRDVPRVPLPGPAGRGRPAGHPLVPRQQ